MTEKAGLAVIGKVSGVPEALMGFVNFRAGMDLRKLAPADEVAVFRIGKTECYHVVFIEPQTSVRSIEKELAKIEAELDGPAIKELEKKLSTRKK